MQTNNDRNSTRSRRVRKRFTIDFWIFLVGSVLIIYFRPFARIFPGLEGYEGIHRVWWPEIAIFATAWALVKTAYLWGFQREGQRREIALVKDDIRRGRITRPSFAVRWLFILCMLGLVSLGWFGEGPSRTRLLLTVVPLFLLFVAVELNIVIHPGEPLISDPSDELLTFFKARMLEAGYIAAMAALAVLYLIYLFAPAYIGLLLPAALVLCLFVPGLVYKYLDRRASTDG